jgi:hypothetical protein
MLSTELQCVYYTYALSQVPFTGLFQWIADTLRTGRVRYFRPSTWTFLCRMG